MLYAKDEFHSCPHCGQTTRHAVVKERVLAPVLWCLSCFRTRVEEIPAHAENHETPCGNDARELRLAG